MLGGVGGTKGGGEAAHLRLSPPPRRCWRSSLVLRSASTSTLSWTAYTLALCLPSWASFMSPLTASSSSPLLLATLRARSSAR